MIKTVLVFVAMALLMSSFTGCDSSAPTMSDKVLCGEQIELSKKMEGVQGKWVLKAYGAGGLSTANCVPAELKEMSLVFKGDGAVQGTSSCNSFSGTYSATAGKMKIADLGFTEMFCGEEAGMVMTWEGHFQKGLEGTVGYSMLGNSLQLKTNNANDLFFLLAAE